VAKLSKKNEDLLKAVKRQASRVQGPAARTGQTGQTALAGEAAQTAQTAQAAQTQFANSKPEATSTVGVGVDIVEIERMERALERTPRIAERVFTSGERTYAWSRPRPAVQYASFFAAREAVLKALGCGFAEAGYQDVEITHDDKGKPIVLLHGNAALVASQQDIVEIQISLSHTHHVAVASAVAIKSLSAPYKNETLSPLEELARQFKELRSLLDDLGVSAIIDNEEEEAGSDSPSNVEEAGNNDNVDDCENNNNELFPQAGAEISPEVQEVEHE
jgi:holo-[acyl-carrier protein] synthase